MSRNTHDRTLYNVPRMDAEQHAFIDDEDDDWANAPTPEVRTCFILHDRLPCSHALIDPTPKHPARNLSKPLSAYS